MCAPGESELQSASSCLFSRAPRLNFALDSHDPLVSVYQYVSMPSREFRTLLSSLVRPAATCERSTLPPWLRLGITFGVLFALKGGLPALGLGPVLQVLALLVVATFFAWRFWWTCSPDRRGVFILVIVLWVAGIAKIARQ